LTRAIRTRVFTLTSVDVQEIIGWIAARATELGATERQSFRAQLSAEELIVNAFKHGGRDALTVSATLLASREKLRLRLEDDGAPFDPSKAQTRETDATVEAARVGGWGIELVRGFAQSVSYRRADGHNVVVLNFTP
jgi:anti-sigma regulatory factor (Ser/Thr protein kinase)